jgi:2-polyprenyl-3-methyl-5-hydroxy-6-metoxy-1,4-benzoquinol methylase
VPRYVETVALPGQTILDFGAGPEALHAKRLKQTGLDVTAYEIGANQNENHDPTALFRQYDIVFASNVLNVQAHGNDLWGTLFRIRDAVKPGGFAVLNYPESPRKLPLNTAQMERIVYIVFTHVLERVAGTVRAPVWKVVK